MREFAMKLKGYSFQTLCPVLLLVPAADLFRGLTHRYHVAMELKPSQNLNCLVWYSCRFRLRKKTWKNPGTVFLEYHVYEEDINISSNLEVFLEVLDGKDFFYLY